MEIERFYCYRFQSIPNEVIIEREETSNSWQGPTPSGTEQECSELNLLHRTPAGKYCSTDDIEHETYDEQDFEAQAISKSVCQHAGEKRCNYPGQSG